MVEVEYRDEYDEMIESGVRYCSELMEKKIPKPLLDSEKCIRCSLNWACLPDEISYIEKKIEEPRRLYPGRMDNSILYVTTVGSKIGKEGEGISIWSPNGEKSIIPRKDIEHICVYGNVQVTTQAMMEITRNGGSIFYFSSGGWLQSVTCSPITKNIKLRISQFEKFKDEELKLELVKSIVKAKIENQRTLLRRNRRNEIEKELSILKNYSNKVNESFDVDSIRGYEGSAARVYWEVYGKQFKDVEEWKMIGRNRRPPLDEINALLSYGYSLLLRDFISAIFETGMDYLYGFYHSIVPGRPALALDLMEPYRALIVDSVVLRMINEGIAKKENFSKLDAGVYMRPEVKKKLIYMYEKRMDEMITHPDFGYRLSYRRMIYLEAKLLGKFLQDELSEYKPLTTR